MNEQILSPALMNRIDFCTACPPASAPAGYGPYTVASLFHPVTPVSHHLFVLSSCTLF